MEEQQKAESSATALGMDEQFEFAVLCGSEVL